MIAQPLVPPPPFGGGWLGGIPVGAVCPYAGQVASPFDSDDVEAPEQPALWLEQWGWLFCDGRELGIALYPMLFSAIGTLYGGDGEATFRLPDYRGLFLRCTDAGAGRDPGLDQRRSPQGEPYYAGVGSTQEDAMQDHQHAYQLASSGTGKAQFQAGKLELPAKPTGSGGPALPDSVSPIKPEGKPARTDLETRPRNIYVNYIIKCR